MYGISGRYDDCAEKFKEAYKAVENAANVIRGSYRGSGGLVFEETATAIIEHLELLENCATVMSKYVADTYAEMYRQDMETSQVFGNTGAP